MQRSAGRAAVLFCRVPEEGLAPPQASLPGHAQQTAEAEKGRLINQGLLSPTVQACCCNSRQDSQHMSCSGYIPQQWESCLELLALRQTLLPHSRDHNDSQLLIESGVVHQHVLHHCCQALSDRTPAGTAATVGAARERAPSLARSASRCNYREVLKVCPDTCWCAFNCASLLLRHCYSSNIAYIPVILQSIS